MVNMSYKKQLIAVISLIILFILVHTLFISGKQTVSWDSLAYSLGLYHIKEVLQTGNMPGWNPYFNSGEPLYIYHYTYTSWQWFLFTGLDSILHIKPVILFNTYFIFLFIFYNIGCYLFFSKIFKDKRIALFCFTVSLYAVSFIMYFQEHTSLYISIYFPYIFYFFLEYIENRKKFSIIILCGLFGIASNSYIPHFFILPFIVFIISYLIFVKKDKHFLTPDKKIIIYGTVGFILFLISISPVLYVLHELRNFISPIRSGSDNILDTFIRITGHHQDYNSILTLLGIPQDNRMILYLGYIPLFLMIVGILKSKNRFHLSILTSAIIIFFISLGRNSFLYILINKYLPTFSVLRHYVALEIFMQFFLICLAGMGLEYILLSPRRITKHITKIIIIVSGSLLLFYTVLQYYLSAVNNSQIPIIMQITLFLISILALFLLVIRRTSRSYYFFFIILLLTSLTYQWYFGYIKFEENKYSNKYSVGRLELQKITSILDDNSPVSWNKTRNKSYGQILTVDGYNTFESGLKKYEYAFWEPINRNLLINKRYYELFPLFEKGYTDYFGVSSPKIFITKTFEILPEKDIIKTMENNYAIYIKEKKVYFAKEDIETTKSSNIFNFNNNIQKIIFSEPEIIQYNQNSIKLAVDSPVENAFLIYLQNYDNNWHAYINGKETRIYRVNYNFQAIHLAEGSNNIEFHFQSPYKYYFIAYIISAIITIICMCFYLIKRVLWV